MLWMNNECKSIYTRELYKKYKQILLGNNDVVVRPKHFLMEGKSGSGKTLFLLWLMNEIFIDAEKRNCNNNDMSIIYGFQG